MTFASADETRAAARRFYDTLNEAIRTGDLALLDAVIAADAIDHNPEPGQRPGLDGIKAGFGAFRAAFPDLRFTVEDTVVESDKAVCRLSSVATHRGEFAGIAPTGAQVTQHGIDILRFADGKLVERWGVFDNLSFMQQLGLTLAP